ncbi:MAG: hypothetical protein ACOYWZ_12000 [Bacillota bacterium]
MELISPSPFKSPFCTVVGDGVGVIIVSGIVSVLNGDAGRPALLYRFPLGLLAPAMAKPLIPPFVKDHRGKANKSQLKNLRTADLRLPSS